MSRHQGVLVTKGERIGDSCDRLIILYRREKMVGNRHSPLCESPAQLVNILIGLNRADQFRMYILGNNPGQHFL